MREPGAASSAVAGLAQAEEEPAQLRVAAETVHGKAAALAATLTAERDALQARLTHRAAAPSPKAPDSTAEELRGAVDELHRLAAALESSHAALTAQVAQRTATLATLNQQLRDCEERLRLAQRYAGAGTWDWDIRGGNVVWSQEYFALHGLDPAAVTPSHAAWVDAVAPMDRAGAEAAVQACLRRCDPDFQVEYRILHPQQGERWLTGRGRLVRDAAGEPLRLLGLTLDITDRKHAELAIAEVNATLRQEVEAEARAREAAQARLFQTLKLEALGQLTGGVAHDFNNLLSVITNGVALLKRRPEAPRRERLLDAMDQAAHRGADLTRRLLSFARRQALRPEPLDLRAWLEDMRELLARALRGDITIEIEAAADLWWARVDPAELELAVLNLGVNARDAMPRGGLLRLCATNVELDALTDPDRLGGAFTRLAVCDTGTGMAPDVLARVFEPFFSTKDVGQGTGLGLAQVYGFARQSGGAARVASQLGKGTTITLLLPRAAPTLPAGAVAMPPTPVAADEGMSLRLLLVEDDDAVAELTAEMLRHLGHAVSRVANAPAAIRALLEGLVVDLVLTDVVMTGGQDGLELAKQIGDEHPGLPILLYSGYGGAPDRVAAAGLPLLRKPYSLEELRRALVAARQR